MLIPPMYREVILTPKFSRSIEAVWSFVSDQAGSSTILPDGRCDIILRFNIKQFRLITPIITGPATRPYKVMFSPGDAWVGVRLRPDQGAFAWKDEIFKAKDQSLRGSDALNKLPKLRGVIKNAKSVIGLKTALMQLPIETFQNDKQSAVFDAIEYAHTTGGQMTVSSLASLASCSPRHLNRLFCASVDLPVKVYCRIVQFHRAVRLIQSKGLSLGDAAFEAGYSDQSHMARSIKEFSGFSPSMLPRDLDRPNLFP